MKKASHRTVGRVGLHFYFKKIRKKCDFDYICLEENLKNANQTWIVVISEKWDWWEKRVSFFTLNACLLFELLIKKNSVAL